MDLLDAFDEDSLSIFSDIPLIKTIEPPPCTSYASYDIAKQSLLAHSRDNGYGIAISKSTPSYSTIKTRYYYQCDRAGKPRSTATKLRTGTRKTGCPFKVQISKEKDQSWKLMVSNPHHNHLPSISPTAHNIHRRRTQAQKQKIVSLARNGVAPRQILSVLRQDDPNTLISDSDIYSEIKQAKNKELGPRTPVEALLDDLSTDEWVYEVKKDAENRVQNLFFAHKNQLEQLRTNPDILMIDCTYKTNRFKLPLMHIIGYSNLDSWFSAGFCFISTEKEEDYYWAVSTFFARTRVSQPKLFISDQEKALKNAIATLLPTVPQLLCIWHLNRNIQTKAQHIWRTADAKTPEEKKQFAEARAALLKRWSQVVYATTEEAFKDQWEQLLSDYSSYQDLCDYLHTYMYPKRQEWAAAWTSQYRHYGTVSTSAIEGKHKVLKMYLTTSQKDLRRVVDAIKDMVQNQFSSFKRELATARFNIKHEYTDTGILAENIHQYITPPALDLLLSQDKLRRDDLKKNRIRLCTGIFERTYGIPCSHTIQQCLNRPGSKVSMLDFKDDHWHFYRQSGPSMIVPPRPNQLTRNPVLVRGPGRPKKNASSTRRDPSAFERPVPPSIPQPPRSVLSELLDEASAASQLDSQSGTRTTPPISVAISVPVSLALTATVSAPVAFSAPVSVSVPISVSSSSPLSSPPFSPISVNVSVPISITLSPPPDDPPPYRATPEPSEHSLLSSAQSSPPSPPKPSWYPALEDFKADIERRRGQASLPTLQTGRNVGAGMGGFSAWLAETGQQNDEMLLVNARADALAPTGIWATATPEVIWSFYFGDKVAYYSWRFAKAQARHPFNTSTACAAEKPLPHPTLRQKRAAAEKASEAWAMLSPRKRQRR